jgi:hypothetical protein
MSYARIEEPDFGGVSKFREVMKNARGRHQSFRESRPVGY